MKCTTCKREMKAHYTSMYCPWCTGDVTKLTLFSGYIAHRDDGMHSPHYVFKHASGAKKWMLAHALIDAHIKEVFSPTPFTWQRGKDSQRHEKIANKNYYLAENHKFDSQEPFIFFAPKSTRQPATPMPPAESEEDTRSEGDRLADFFATSLNR